MANQTIQPYTNNKPYLIFYNQMPFNDYRNFNKLTTL